MKVTEVKYARKFNTGNYENEEFGVSALVEDGETPTEVLAALKAEVQAAFAGVVAEAEAEAEEEDDAEEIEETEAEGNEDEEDDTEEEDEDDSEESDDSPKTGKTEKKQSKKSSTSTASDGKAGKAATGKKFKARPQIYSRNNETHKEIFSGILRAVAPKWKDSETSRELGKATSKAMHGKDFLDEAGEVYASFKELVRKAMNPVKGKKK